VTTTNSTVDSSTVAFPLWAEGASCQARGVDPDLFHPEGRGLRAVLQTKQAKAVCGSCPLVARCADWALTAGEEHGIWGGLDPDDRERVRLAAAEMGLVWQDLPEATRRGLLDANLERLADAA
jgi:WhiB family redox-sensing transcriptional regulator